MIFTTRSEDFSFRKELAEKAGFGYELSSVVPIVPKETVCEAAKPCKSFKMCEKEWSGREDSNLRPPGPEPGALPG
jgi:hypothetical protein